MFIPDKNLSRLRVKLKHKRTKNPITKKKLIIVIDYLKRKGEAEGGYNPDSFGLLELWDKLHNRTPKKIMVLK